MTQDIVERLRQEVVWEPEVGQLLAEAAREIERLRGEVVLWQAAPPSAASAGSAETERKTRTD